MTAIARYRTAFIVVISLFFLWGFAHNMNPILIPHLKKTCRLSDLESSFVDSAFFIAYFTMALPAGFFIRKFGYKKALVTGLMMFAFGAALFYPAAETRAFGFFLLALFIVGSGLTFLETGANPYITLLGDKDSATQRLNFAQSFNGLAATLAPLVGGLFILSGKDVTDASLALMSASEAEQLLTAEADAVKLPYLIISAVVFVVGIIIMSIPFPDVRDQGHHERKFSQIFRHRNLVLGVLAQFFYVGAQVCISSFFIRFLYHAALIPEKTAAYYLSLALLLFMIGRFAGTFFMKYISPHKLLLIYALLCMMLVGVAILFGGGISVYALIGVQFFMSIMFPTIFALGIRNLGNMTETGSSLLIMAIVGGAVFPPMLGLISDAWNIQVAYIVPLLCFGVVLLFALRTEKLVTADQSL